MCICRQTQSLSLFSFFLTLALANTGDVYSYIRIACYVYAILLKELKYQSMKFNNPSMRPLNGWRNKSLFNMVNDWEMKYKYKKGVKLQFIYWDLMAGHIIISISNVVLIGNAVTINRIEHKTLGFVLTDISIG